MRQRCYLYLLLCFRVIYYDKLFGFSIFFVFKPGKESNDIEIIKKEQICLMIGELNIILSSSNIAQFDHSMVLCVDVDFMIVLVSDHNLVVMDRAHIEDFSLELIESFLADR